MSATSKSGQRLSLLSLIFGVLVALPTQGSWVRAHFIWMLTWGIQSLVTEFSLFGVVLGTLGILRGAGKARWMSAAGTALSARPLFQAIRLAHRMDTAMRQGLGNDYAKCIPAAMRQRMAPTPLSLETMLQGFPKGDVQESHDIPYRTVDGQTLLLDVYEPPDYLPDLLSSGRPVVIAIHGGGWHRNDKGMPFDTHWRWLASQGYVVFDIQYRLSPAAKFPAHLEDVKAAIRWVRANAARYHADPTRIALRGWSAGAHLALLAAYTAEDEDAAVQAVIAAYPPTDLLLWPAMAGSPLAAFLGGLPEDVPDIYRQASPVNHIHPNVPPTLLIQGQKDGLVPPEHAEALYNRLRILATPAVLLRLPWSRHAFDASIKGYGGQIAQFYTDRFLSWSLYGQRHCESA